MATYDITNIDKYQCLTGALTTEREGTVVKLDDTHFFIAFGGYGNDGYAQTYSHDGSYDSLTQIDSLEFDTVQSMYNSACLLDSSHVIMASSLGVNSGKTSITIFAIDGSYNISVTTTQALSTTNYDYYCGLAMLDSTHGVTCHRASTQQVMCSFSVDGSYNVTLEDTLVTTTTTGTYQWIAPYDSTHVITSASTTSNEAIIRIYGVDGSWDLSSTSYLIYTAGDSDIKYHHCCYIKDGYIANVYSNAVKYPVVQTFSVSGVYAIVSIDSLQLEDNYFGFSGFSTMDENTLILSAYEDANDDGYNRVFTIDDSADNITSQSKVIFNADYTTAVDHKVIDNYIITIYRGNDGAALNFPFIATASVEMPAPPSSGNNNGFFWMIRH